MHVVATVVQPALEQCELVGVGGVALTNFYTIGAGSKAEYWANRAVDAKPGETVIRRFFGTGTCLGEAALINGRPSLSDTV